MAHRGIFNNLNIPENSLRAFKLAVNRNIDIELDVQLTKDEKLVVFHDYNLYRMTHKNLSLKKCTYKEIKKFNLLDTDQNIPLLEEVLDIVDGKILINIEIKNTDRKKKTLDILNKVLSNYNGKVIIQTFHSKYLSLINKYYPSYTKGLLISTPEILLDNLVDSKANLIKLKPDFLAYNKELIKSKKVQHIRKKIPIFSWTIKNKEEKISSLKYSDSIIMNIR